MMIEERIQARLAELLKYRGRLQKELVACNAALGELQAILEPGAVPGEKVAKDGQGNRAEKARLEPKQGIIAQDESLEADQGDEEKISG